METYITVVSPNIYSVINPFWAGVDKGWIKASSCILFYAPEHKKELQKITRWLSEIAKVYALNEALTIHLHPFGSETK